MLCCQNCCAFGVRIFAVPQGYTDSGLSPRVRGNHVRRPCGILERRSIPACAGEPPLHVRLTMLRKVYPRVCGGTWPGFCGNRAMGGLSPRVRGNLACFAPDGQSSRSIPACAGEPREGIMDKAIIWVYPRVCGGTGRPYPMVLAFYGLSPRVRGNQRPGSARNSTRRSIPACAGEPGICRFPVGEKRVYPRVCGGTARKRQQWCWQRGLSPRVRGNHATDLCALLLIGSIPACAGEPAQRDPKICQKKVYPRVCGGT